MAAKLHYLASYGTLAPGRSNHDQLSNLDGRWLTGTVRGNRTTADRGRWVGYPGFRLDTKADPVEMPIFESADLPDHWERLDAFEGDAYQRVQAIAETDEGPIAVWLYELKVSAAPHLGKA